MAEKFDFSGWATKNNLLCADGRVIRRDAFKENDGQTVPLVYQHQHTDPTNILGHALLENRDEGVYAYCSFNNNDNAQAVKEAVRHGDVVSLSIYANKLVQKGKDVLHGAIREVSVVLAGANPGAYIDNPVLVHGEGTENETYEDDLTEAVIYHSFDGESDIVLSHADADDEKEDKPMADKPKETEPKEGKTVQDVFDTLNDEQKKVVYFMIGKAVEDAKGQSDDEDDEDDDEGDATMKHNIFEGDQQTGRFLSHADQATILANARSCGSFRQALGAFVDENDLQHDGLAPVSGFSSYPNGATPAGVDALFPEWHDVRPGAPELVTDDLDWVKVVLNRVHRSPFSRIRTSQVDIRGLEALRAHGYSKGKEKILAGQYAVAKRTTDPQTVTVKSGLNRDDIIDITDFDYVSYQYNIDKMQLEEELATAMLIGDQRADNADDKIEPVHIRPIWGDDPLFTITKNLTTYMTDLNGDFSDNFGENYKYAEAMVAAVLDAMIDYRGSGNVDMFCTQQFVNKMLLARDLNGRRIYANKQELATALGVRAIHPVSKFANKTRAEGEGAGAKTYKLDAILVNLADYTVGSTKGGEITHFTDFDLNFNQLLSLIETRLCGANTRIYSAIAIEEEVA